MECISVFLTLRFIYYLHKQPNPSLSGLFLSSSVKELTRHRTTSPVEVMLNAKDRFTVLGLQKRTAHTHSQVVRGPANITKEHVNKNEPDFNTRNHPCGSKNPSVIPLA